MQLLDFGAHFRAQQRIQIRQRLVEQKQLRLPNDGPAHCDSLPLPAGKRTRLAVEQMIDLENCGSLFHAPVDVGSGKLA